MEIDEKLSYSLYVLSPPSLSNLADAPPLFPASNSIQLRGPESR